MKCKECGNEGFLHDIFEVLEVQDTKRGLYDYDNILKLKCKKCGHEFKLIN